MKLKAILCALSLAVTVTAAQAADGALLYIGTRGPAGAAPGTQGVYAARFDSKTGKLALQGLQLEISRVSWITAHPAKPILFMLVNPGGSTTVESQLYSFAVDKSSGHIRQLSQIATGGRDTTHMAFDAKSGTLFGGSFQSGMVSAYSVMSDGSLGAMTSSQKESGKGPLPEQNAPHTHAVAMDASGRHVITANIGADRVFVYGFDRATRTLTPGDPPFIASAPGSGPRHLAFHPNGKFLYMNSEMSAEAYAYAWDARRGQLTQIQALPAYPSDYRGEGEKSSAEIGLDRSGRHLYLTLRGDQNSIVVYDVDTKTGRLTEKQRLASGGRSPRSFAIDPSGRWMLVAHDVSGSVNVFAIDAKSGELKPTAEIVPVPGAASLAFF